MGTVTEFVRPIPVMEHIAYRIRNLEKEIKGVVCLQFADHPEGLSMIVRVYVAATEKEFVFPDVVYPIEFCNANKQTERIDVLFDMIHTSLESIQVVQDKSGGLIHKA